MSVTGDILRSYRAPQQVVRDILGRGRREDRALAWAMVSCLLIFVAQWPRLARQAHLSPELEFNQLLAGALFGWLFIAPLVLYGLAAVLHLLQRLFRQPSTMWSARVATFWALLAASPLWLLSGVVMGVAGPGALASITGFVALVAYIVFVMAGLRAAALEGSAATA